MSRTAVVVKACGATVYFLKMQAQTQWINRRPLYPCSVLDEVQIGSETSASFSGKGKAANPVWDSAASLFIKAPATCWFYIKTSEN